MKKILLWIIDRYRKDISPYKGGPCCKYVPSCSEYGRTAVMRYGAFKGGCMAIWRIMRCNPFSKGGYDPVPLPYKGQESDKTDK